MGPVSFQRIGEDLDADALFALAKRLRAVGIIVQSVDGGNALLVRSEDFVRAREVADAAPDDHPT